MDGLADAAASPPLPDDDELRSWIGARLEDGRARVTGARAYSSAVFRYDEGAIPLAVKVPVGGAWQRHLLRREWRAYQRIAGLPGFPRCFKLLDGRVLILEWIDATPFRFAEIGDREAFFARLRSTLDAMHERGLAHGDLKKKENLLVTDDDRPVILDLGTAVRRGEGLGRLLFRWLERVDDNAWLKLKYGPGLPGLTAADRRYHRPTLPERLGRRLRRDDGRDPQRRRPRLSTEGGPVGAERSTRRNRRRKRSGDSGDENA